MKMYLLTDEKVFIIFNNNKKSKSFTVKLFFCLPVNRLRSSSNHFKWQKRGSKNFNFNFFFANLHHSKSVQNQKF